MGPNLDVSRFGWEEITMPAHLPYVAEAATVISPQSGRAANDGVIALGSPRAPGVVAYTGPVEVLEFGVTVRPDQAATFILEDQYLLAQEAGNDTRMDALDTLGERVIESLLAGALPVPSNLAPDLEPFVDVAAEPTPI